MGRAGFPQLPPSINSAWIASGCFSSQSHKTPLLRGFLCGMQLTSSWITCVWWLYLPQPPSQPNAPSTLCQVPCWQWDEGKRESLGASSWSHVLWETGLGPANGECLLSSHIKDTLQRRALQKGLLVCLSGPVTEYPNTAAG